MRVHIVWVQTITDAKIILVTTDAQLADNAAKEETEMRGVWWTVHNDIWEVRG